MEVNAESGDSVAINYVGMTSCELLRDTRTTIHNSARTYTNVKYTLQHHFLKCAVDLGIEFDLKVYAMGDRVDVNLGAVRNESGLVVEAGQFVEGLTFAKFILYPEMDLVHKLFISVFGFGCLNIATGGVFRAIPTEGPLYETVKACLGPRLKASIHQVPVLQAEGDIVLSTGESSGSQTGITLNEAWVEGYFALLNSLPHTVIGDRLKPDLKQIILRQLLDFGDDMIGNDSILSVLIGKDISKASFSRCLSRWCFSAGDGVFLFNCLVDLVYRLATVDNRRADRTFPSLDVWNCIEKKAILTMIAHWVIPTLHTLRPLVVRVHSAPMFLMMSNMLVDVDRCIVGSSSLPRASLLTIGPNNSNNPVRRYLKYFSKCEQFEDLFLFDTAGVTLLPPDVIKSRRIAYFDETFGNITNLRDIYVKEAEDAGLKEMSRNFQFIHRHAGIPKLVAYSLNWEDDCCICVGNLDPGFAKYDRKLEQAVVNITVVIEAISTLVECFVKQEYRVGSGQSRWSQLETIMERLKRTESYRSLMNELNSQKTRYRELRGIDDEDSNAPQSNPNAGINIKILGDKRSDVRRQQLQDIKFKISKMGFIGFDMVLDPIQSLSVDTRQNLERVWGMPILDFIFLNGYSKNTRMAGGTRVAFSCLPFADVAQYDYQLMKKYATIARSTKNPYKNPEDMAHLKPEEIKEFLKVSDKMHVGRDQLWTRKRAAQGQGSSSGNDDSDSDDTDSRSSATSSAAVEQNTGTGSSAIVVDDSTSSNSIIEANLIRFNATASRREYFARVAASGTPSMSLIEYYNAKRGNIDEDSDTYSDISSVYPDDSDSDYYS